MQQKQKTLLVGALISLFLFALFGWLQTSESRLLQLPVQWLAIAILPVLVALFMGGFITRFKGFGVELESTLKAPVTSLSLTASDAVADIPGDEKRSFVYLESLSREKKLATRWLLFRSGRKGYYTSSGIGRYMEELPNIEYFEIRSEDGEFICFIPSSTFREEDLGQYGSNILYEKLDQFIGAIEENNVPNAFSGSAITLKVSSDQELLEVIKAMRSEKADFAAVVSPSGKYLGVVFAHEVEKRITDSVLATQPA